MYPWSQCTLDCIPCSTNIFFIGAAQSGNYGDISILVDFITDYIRNLFDGIKVIRTGNGESSLDDINAKLGEITCNFKFFRAGECGAGRLLTVAECGVENTDIVGIGDVAGDVFGAWTAFVEFRDEGGVD